MCIRIGIIHSHIHIFQLFFYTRTEKKKKNRIPEMQFWSLYDCQ